MGASPSPADRIRHLLALDASNVLTRLRAHQDEMVALYSRMRSREPMLQASHSWFLTITFQELAALAPAEQRAVSHFYEVLAELRWYLEYTQDMPGTVRSSVGAFLTRLTEAHRTLSQAIGPADGQGAPVVAGQVLRGSGKRRRA